MPLLSRTRLSDFPDFLYALFKAIPVGFLRLLQRCCSFFLTYSSVSSLFLSVFYFPFPCSPARDDSRTCIYEYYHPFLHLHILSVCSASLLLLLSSYTRVEYSTLAATYSASCFLLFFTFSSSLILAYRSHYFIASCKHMAFICYWTFSSCTLLLAALHCIATFFSFFSSLFLVVTRHVMFVSI